MQVHTSFSQSMHTDSYMPSRVITTVLLSETCSASYSRGPFTASGCKTAEGLCALSHQAMREELACVYALVRRLAEIRVNKQHIVTPDSDPARLR